MPLRTIISRETSMSAFKTSKDRLPLLLGPVQLVTLSWSQCSLTILKLLGPLRIMLNLLCLYSVSGTTKLGWQPICLQHGLLNILSPMLRATAQKSFLWKYSIHWQWTWSSKSLWYGFAMLLLSHFSCVWLCVTPQTAAHQAPPSLGFSRQEHWSGLPFPSPMHESEKWKWSRSVWLFVTPWTAAHQAPPSMGFSRQEYWSGLSLPSPWIYNEINVSFFLFQQILKIIFIFL